MDALRMGWWYESVSFKIWTIKTLFCCWVSCHTGIGGNEKADSAAKVVPYTALKHCISQHILSTWQGDWNGREREMFYLTTHSTHFIYGYMASDIWLRTILIVRKETRCRHMGYSYRLTARVLLYAPSHRQEHWLEREIAQWVHPMKDRSDDPPHHERTLYLWATSRSQIGMMRLRTSFILSKPVLGDWQSSLAGDPDIPFREPHEMRLNSKGTWIFFILRFMS